MGRHHAPARHELAQVGDVLAAERIAAVRTVQDAFVAIRHRLTLDGSEAERRGLIRGPGAAGGRERPTAGHGGGPGAAGRPGRR